jgi:hypothetical protein
MQMRLSRSGAFVGGVVFTVIIGGGTAVAAGSSSVLFGHGNVGKTATGLTNTKGTPLSLVAKKGAPPLKVSSTVKVKNLDSDLLDGKDSSSFLASTAKAADSSLLGGQPPTAYLGAGATAADSARLGGLPASGYLASSGTATNATELGGLPASSYTSTVYSATTTNLQDPIPTLPVTKIDNLTLPPGTWSMSLAATLSDVDGTIGGYTCSILAGLTNHVTVAAFAPVDIMAANATQTTMYQSLATSGVISVTVPTPAFTECSPASNNDHDDAVVDTSSLTATRVTDPHGTVVAIN